MKPKSDKYTLLSLFTGAGGLDLGLEAAGFEPVLCVEVDSESRETLKANRPAWRLSDPGDIHELEPRQLLRQCELSPRQLTLLAGGPPCQPFSKSMYWSTGDAPRLRDPRAKTLHAYLDVVATMLPQVLLLENVKGLAFEGKDEGLRLLKRGLRSSQQRALNVIYSAVDLTQYCRLWRTPSSGTYFSVAISMVVKSMCRYQPTVMG